MRRQWIGAAAAAALIVGAAGHAGAQERHSAQDQVPAGSGGAEGSNPCPGRRKHKQKGRTCTKRSANE